MKKTGLIALLLALLLVLTGCQSANEVLSVGSVSYSLTDLEGMEAYLRDYYDYMGQMYMMYYGFNPMSYTDEDIRNEALNTLAVQAVVLDKANQLKLNNLTEEEKTELNAAVDASLQEYRDSIEATLTFAEDATDEQKQKAVDEEMTKQGVTRDVVYKSEFENLMFERAQAYVTKDVTVTDEEFVTAFNEQVAAEKESYAADLSAYGVEVLNGGAPLYAPAGYRNVKQILIQYSEEDSEKITAINSAMYTAASAMVSAEAAAVELLGEEADLDALKAEVTVTLNEITDPTAITVKESVTAFTTELSEEAAAAVKALAEADAVGHAYEEQMNLAAEAALANIAPEADEVLSRLEAGEDWDALAAEFNDDPGMMEGAPTAVTGYPVCEGFAQFDQAFVNAAMAIESVGQWSDKTVGKTYGYYIIQYTSDVAEGEVDKESVRETMTAELLAAKQEEAFSAALDQWVTDAQSTGRLVINYGKLN
ncbi:MAG: peptidylprolyl isomerase [Clostridia bacterium]|nr:peptidylprolyl isomerase [Clostridia bacterium]